MLWAKASQEDIEGSNGLKKRHPCFACSGLWTLFSLERKLVINVTIHYLFQNISWLHITEVLHNN